MSSDVLELFAPATRDWFRGTFGEPTHAQRDAWQAAHAGEHTLVIAPTGSGKTLAAFLLALDRLTTQPPPADQLLRCRVLYVSPLKALAVDVQRNLHTPLNGIALAAQRVGAPAPAVTVGMRTGDTPARERKAFQRTPPDILVTTPESLYLLLTSRARESLRGVRTVIVDEVHAVVDNKRGAHLALSLERLDALLPNRAQRIGLSATVRPVEEISTFLAGGRPVRVVNPDTPKVIEVAVEVPVPDMTSLPAPDDGDVTPAASRAAARQASIWPAVERRIYELIMRQRSTIVFVNSRRAAERLTARLNELHSEHHQPSEFPAEAIGQSGVAYGVEETIARSHHGSMARQARTTVEAELKAGTLRCVVATSSLELGIDMGAVDLVVQVQAPPTVAAGLQRVGRAGHHVGAVSTGVIFPQFRGDLVACAVVAERMRDGAIETLRFPRNPLDVLAQQIVAMVAMDSLTVDDLARIVRGAAPYLELPDGVLTAVLDMLAGRYPSTDFGEFRPRITWDRATGWLEARPGAQRLAVTSGGTIPDRGLYLVMTQASEHGPGSRVGELDEEMVHESRVSDTILLGTSSWRITEITHDRVLVVPAPGEAARMPFWKGDSPGRPLELGIAAGAFVRDLSTATAQQATARALRTGLDEWACDNLLSYLADQRAATGYLPDDKTVVLERFRDEVGDWRVVLHSPFGAQVNAPWALAIAAKIRSRSGIDAQVMPADDGIVLRLPADDPTTPDAVISTDDVLIEHDDVERILRDEVGTSSLFAARFRECAARSLLLPRRDPRRRQPLWQQRQRSSQLLAVASRYESFPVVLEAMRECLADVYDVAGLRTLMAEIHARTVRVVEVETPSPSPFARSLLLGYVGLFLYGTDTPLAERKAAALTVDSTLLAELLGTESLNELLDPSVIAEVEESLQYLTADRQATGVEDTADLLRVLGDLTEAEAASRGVRPEWVRSLEEAGRAITVRIAGREAYAAVEDAGRLRDALDVELPAGIPGVFTEPVADPRTDLLSRYARRRGPFTAHDVATRFGLPVAEVVTVLDRLTADSRLVKVDSTPGPSRDVPDDHLSYCDAGVLRRIRRRCVARLRAEVEPVEPRTLGRFLPAWHGITATESTHHPATADALLSSIEQLAGAALPASAVESLVLPARLPGYSPALLDQLTTTGELTWCGCGALRGGDGWVAFAPTDVADLLLPDPVEPVPDEPLHSAILAVLSDAAPGAVFFRQLVDAVSGVVPATQDAAVVAALWELVWAGLVSGDSIAALRAVLSGGGATPRSRTPAPRGRYARLRTARQALPTQAGPPTVAGRWALVPPRDADLTRRAHARAESFLERHGVLTRGALDSERVSGGFSGIYRVLRGMEDAGQVVRGYVVDGLGAAQFAAPGAVDRLRATASEPARGVAIILAATDPAQPYGAVLPWPEPIAEGHRPARKAGALTVLVDGEPVLYLERGGSSVLSFTDDVSVVRAAARSLVDLVSSGRIGPLVVRKANGERALVSTLGKVLRDAGFRPTPQGLRLRS